MKITPQGHLATLEQTANCYTRLSMTSLPSTYTHVWRRARAKTFAVYSFWSVLQQKTFLRKKTHLIDTANSLSSSSSMRSSQEFESIFIIQPDSKFKSIWELYMGILMLYTAFVTPFILAFIDSSPYDSWFYIDIYVDISFFIDLIINCNSAFYNSNGSLVSSRKKIITAYAKSWLVLDLISCVPFNLFDSSQSQHQYSNQDDYKTLLKLLRLPKLYRIFRIVKIMKMVSNYRQGQILEKIQDCMNLQQSGIRLLTSVLTIIVALHIMACFWFYSAKIEGFNPNTWVTINGLVDSDVATLYITSLYWAATTFSTVGYGDIPVNTTTERIFAIIWMIFSVYYFSFVIGSLTSMLENVYLKSNFLRNKLAIIDDFSKDAHLPKSLLNKLRRALKYSNKTTCLSTKERDAILNELSTPLKYEIAVAMHDQAYSKINYFQDKDKVIITAIVPYLRPAYVEQDDYVYTKGEHAEGIYFIIKGFVSYIVRKNEIPVYAVHCGEYFGDIEVSINTTRKYTTLALRNTDLLIMDMNLIQKFTQEYLDEWIKIKREAIEKDLEILKNIAEVKEQAEGCEELDSRAFKLKVEKRILKKRSKNDLLRKKNRLNINVMDVNRKIENLCTRLYNLESNIKGLKNRRVVGVKKTLPPVFSTQGSFVDSDD